MKCRFCGAENFRSSGPCRVCGKQLVDLDTLSQGRQATGYTAVLPTVTTTDEVSRRYRMRYEHERDANMKILDGLGELFSQMRDPELKIPDLLEHAARFMHQQFRLRWVAIGLKGSDGVYRYVSMVGFREDVAEKRKNQTFRRSDFLEDTRYKGWTISDQTRLYLEEDKPYTEGAEATFNRPMLMKTRRRAPDDSLEADYIDVHIYGISKDLLGWIESSGTITGKLPDVSVLRWMETFASVLGMALVRKRVY